MVNRLVLMFIFTPYFSFGQLLINEFSARGGYEDYNGNNCDWVEIINVDSSEINLSDYFLSDNITNLQKWRLPDEIISPMELMLICLSGDNIRERVRIWGSLVDSSSEWRYFEGYNEPDEDWKEISFNDSSWNSGYAGFGFNDYDDTTIITGVTSFYLRKEFIINDDSIVKLLLHADYDDAFIAYINGFEIARSKNIYGEDPAYNHLSSGDHEALGYRSLPLEIYAFDYQMIDTLLHQGKNILSIQVHDADSISNDMSANFFLHAGLNSDTNSFESPISWFTSASTHYHANFKLSYEENIIVSDLTGNIIDSKLVNTDLSRMSEGRASDGSIDWGYFNNPTPGITNDSSICYEGISDPPNISLSSGWYDNQQSVTLTSDTLSQIYYTTNGDMPDTNDHLYIDTLFIDSTTVLSARSFSSNTYLPSQVVDRTFIFNEENHNLPVFSIITDSLNLWGWDSGIYVLGPNADTTYPYSGANFKMPWSKWSRLEFFDKDKQKQAEEEFDLEIHGGASRGYPQKSFRLDFKSKYTGNLVYPLFSQKPYINKFNNINLRNGGSNPAKYDRIRDGLISEIAYSTNLDIMGYEPCILYLNGEFWGQYAIREKIDEHYVENNHNLNSDSIDLMNRNGSLCGTDIHFVNTYHMIMNTDPNSNSFYNLISERFDLDNYIDYFIVETYLQNRDWYAGYNNIKLWRHQNNGKWRYILYDVDQTFVDNDPDKNFIDISRNPYQINSNNDTVDLSSMHSQLFNRVLMNDKFKCKFIIRYADLVNTIFHPDTFRDKSQELKDKLTSVLPNQIDRWGMPGSMAVWENRINLLSESNEIRAPYALKHVSESFGLDTVTYKTFRVFPPNSGRIRINTVAPDSFPWSGYFFREPCYSYAIAFPEESDYFFSYWSLYKDTVEYKYYNDTLDLSIEQSDSLIAHFRNCDNDIDLILNSDTISNVLYPTFYDYYAPYNYSWFLDGIEIIGHADSAYNPISTGYYNIMLTDNDGCSILSESIYFDCDVLMHPILYKDSVTNSLEVMCDEGSGPYSYEWIYYDKVIMNYNNYNLDIYSTGNYKVVVTDINGCSSLTDSIIVKNHEVLVYPNPSKYDVNLQFMLVNGSQYNVYISDIKNNILFKEKVSESLSNELYKIKFNLEGLIPGIYFITLESNENKVTKKFIFYN